MKNLIGQFGTNAYEHGFSARLAGRSEHDNPHDPQSDEFTDWRDGWREAADQTRDQDTSPI